MADQSNGNNSKRSNSSDEETTARPKIKWRIKKFETLMRISEPREDLWSEGVSSELAPRAVWKLRIYPNGNSEQYKGNIGVFLYLTGLMKDNGEDLDAAFHIYLVDGSDGSKIDVLGRRTKNFGKGGHYNWGWHASHDRVKKALQADGSLLLAADIDFLAPDDGALHDYKVLQQWAAKISELYGDQASSNCTIQIGGTSIPAHKSILTAQSPIFRAMFTPQEAEQSSIIKITDFKEPEPMRALVRYCYQGKLDTETMDGEEAVEIFKLADRYCVAGLKAQLEKHFVHKRLCKENVVAMAVLADTYTAPKLKKACIKLIAMERDNVFERADWKQLKKARPKLAADLTVETVRIRNKMR